MTGQKFTIIENTFIQLKDGVKLAMRIWLPLSASQEYPVPAVLEILPYRKRDNTAYRDEITYAHFACHGYAGVRVDMRGCGDSTGDIQDEYVHQEQEDALEVIDWLIQQPWCTGKIGMMGISWGGFNSLQLAYRQPDALKAIISICFTDDRYSDDIHYKGGVMLMDNLKWAASMEIRNSIPPDPMFNSDWQSLWISRLKTSPHLVKKWLSHPLRDDYWRHGSVCEDYDKIVAATFLIGGYADGYTNAVQRTLDNITCPKRALIGPWTHLYPHIAKPGPVWGFCTEAVKWWDQHLKGLAQPEEPQLISYIQDEVEVPTPAHVPGRWVCDHTSEMKTYYMWGGRLGDEKGTEMVDICSPETCGQMGGVFFPVKLYDMPLEQSRDDEVSCMFETECFVEPVELLGQPVVHLAVASDQPIANIFVRLCIVNPQGQSRLVAYSAFNLNHDDKHETMKKLVPGEFQQIQVPLDYIGEKINHKYKLRLCLSSAYFPMFIPNPKHTTLTVDLSRCKLQIPILKAWKELPNEIPPLTDMKPKPTKIKKPPARKRTVEVDENGRTTITTKTDTGKKLFTEHNLVTHWLTEQMESITPDDPSSVELRIKHDVTWSRDEDWKVNIVYQLRFTADSNNFYTSENRTVYNLGTVIFEEQYDNTFPRFRFGTV